MKNILNTQSIDIEKAVMWGLLGVLVCMAISYAYFVNQTVLNVVARKDIEEHITQTSATIAEMEYAYMQEKSELSESRAYALGFHEVEHKSFVTRGSGDVVTFRE